ncbi:MAG: YciI family protein [Mycobacterium sp.]
MTAGSGIGSGVTQTSDHSAEVNTLLQSMLRKRLWVALTTLCTDQAGVLPHRAEHLRWMSQREVDGVLWASAPFPAEGVVIGDGMTILNVATEEAARALMDDEPLIRRGLRTYELRAWELREGRITVELSASTSQFRLA